MEMLSGYHERIPPGESLYCRPKAPLFSDSEVRRSRMRSFGTRRVRDKTNAKTTPRRLDLFPRLNFAHHCSECPSFGGAATSSSVSRRHSANCRHWEHHSIWDVACMGPEEPTPKVEVWRSGGLPCLTENLALKGRKGLLCQPSALQPFAPILFGERQDYHGSYLASGSLERAGAASVGASSPRLTGYRHVAGLAQKRQRHVRERGLRPSTFCSSHALLKIQERLD
ncbi:uncharacterized protein B0H64DRAFT_214126 [Chaetomium fimeti]|uniref:Uncharacterized protein n=1 Tax=Chaetomium fimeti TaxID=1854472 RepID=A0AAE0HBI1_9PEZI|nr:hypothetical protein B0H64DRAFT_214126 [Chaetomium fimeti]